MPEKAEERAALMSREIEIRDRIARLDPAGFQNLAQELLTQRFGYDKRTQGVCRPLSGNGPGDAGHNLAFAQQQIRLSRMRTLFG